MNPKDNIKIEQSSEHSYPSKEPKYNYLEHSFEKTLQRSYDRNQIINNHQRCSPTALQSPPNVNLKFDYNSPKGRTPPFSHIQMQRSSQFRSSEFSPYENKQNNVRDRLMIHEIQKQNQLFLEKIGIYEKMIEELQFELNSKNQELETLNQLLYKEKTVNQKIVQEMKEEIDVLLTKNSLLEKRCTGLERELKEIERSKQVIESRSRAIFASIETETKSTEALLDKIKSILTQQYAPKHPRSRERDSGKVINVSRSFNNSPKKANTERVNLPQHYASKTGPEKSQIIFLQLQQKMYRLHKFQQLIVSIQQMYKKIMGKKLVDGTSCGSDLKMVWKWMKMLGNNFNITNKWKNVLIQSLQMNKVSCCGIKGDEESIQDLYQKIVMVLHQRVNEY